ncbi:MAG: hypothetical protein KF686_03575 [Ramlibacter sp.]|nr:hypothetical protein [Ramlibacter sp.]
MSDKHPPTREIYVRHTDTAGKSHVMSHLVWDAEKFIASLKTAAEKVNADQKPGDPRKANAEQVTYGQYLMEKK